jgi:hypothetical protein
MSRAEQLQKHARASLFTEDALVVIPEDPLPGGADDTFKLTVGYKDGTAVMVTFRDLSAQEVDTSWSDESAEVVQTESVPMTDAQFEQFFGVKLDKETEDG